jgi:hypothetical protein
VDLDLEGNKLTVVQVYAPTEDADVIGKEQFFSVLQRVVDEARTDNRKLVVMGELNERIGQDQRAGHGSMGRYGVERIRNINGKRLIDFCIDNGLLIGNTFFNHKQIIKITFEGEGRDVKSIIDYILYPVELRYMFKVVKVIRGAELSTDHRLLVTDTRFRKGLPEKTKKYQKLFTEKLRREGTQEEYQKNLENKLEFMTREEGYENWNVDDRWTKLKSVIMDVTEQTCRKKWVNTKRKKTRWWSETVREAVKRKKKPGRSMLGLEAL